MEYFKFSLSFLNTITFTSSTYTELDTYLNGVVKNNLNHNNSFLPLAPTQEELDELKNELSASYDLMLGDIKPRYEEVLRLGTVHTFRSKDTTDSVYGDEEKTGKYYEPIVSSAQASVKTNGELTTWEDDKVTLSREEDRVLNQDAIKEFFKDIKEEVELYFIDYINLFGDGCEGERPFLNEEQLDAINSGIDADKVAQIGTNKDNIALLSDALGEVIIDLSGKQDKLNQTQLDAVNSGIDSTKVGQIASNTTAIGNNATAIGNNTTAISAINVKIPSEASSSNKLADKNFVNSSIATNTANFIGTFNSVADLESYSGTLTNNDYAFVVGVDGDGNTTYSRYKYNATTQTWNFEYVLNNSSFTASQWATINSGLTSSDATKLSGIESGAQVNVQADWNEADNTKDDYIKNKPTIPDISNLADKQLSNLQTINPTLTSSSVTINSKVGTKYVGGHFVVESWKATDNTQWYRKYSDGFIECGGVVTVSPNFDKYVSLPISFTTTNYVLNASVLDADVDANVVSPKMRELTTTQFRIALNYASSNFAYYAGGDVAWYACGY